MVLIWLMSPGNLEIGQGSVGSEAAAGQWQLYETPLNCAVRFVEDNVNDDDDDDEPMSKRIQIVELLRDAGGNAREATLDKSFMGDPPTFSYFDY